MHKTFISKDDYKGLMILVEEYEKQSFLSKEIKGPVFALKRVLRKAEIIELWDSRLIDAVTMNSSVRFKNLSTKEEKEYLIVYPKLECKSLGRISILSEIGVALLWHKKWEIVRVKKSNGDHYLVQILNVQPTSMEWIKRLEEQC